MKKNTIILISVILISLVGGYLIYSTISNNKEEAYKSKLQTTTEKLEIAVINSAIMASVYEKYWGKSIKQSISSTSIESDLGIRLVEYNSLLTNSNSGFLRSGSGKEIKKGEFNTVLKVVSLAKEDEISEIINEHSIISNLVSDLKNPPEKYSKQYDAILGIFEIYTNLNNLASSPSGSYIEYSKSINSLYDSLSIKIDTIKLQID